MLAWFRDTTCAVGMCIYLDEGWYFHKLRCSWYSQEVRQVSTIPDSSITTALSIHERAASCVQAQK